MIWVQKKLLVGKASAIILLMMIGMIMSGCNKKNPSDLKGIVRNITGDAFIYKAVAGDWRSAQPGAVVVAGDSIATNNAAEITIDIGNNNTIDIDENSLVALSVFNDSIDGLTVEFAVGLGTLVSNIENLSALHNYRVTTPTSVASIRGTFFAVSFEAERRVSRVNVFGGKVWVHNPLLPMTPPVVVFPGLYTEVYPDIVPVAPIRIPYGQWKKMQRVMRPALFLRYNRKLKFDRDDHVDGFNAPGRPLFFKGPFGRDNKHKRAIPARNAPQPFPRSLMPLPGAPNRPVQKPAGLPPRPALAPMPIPPRLMRPRPLTRPAPVEMIESNGKKGNKEKSEKEKGGKGKK